jgi:tRNA1Val (adenine37-N6)-methyltransferase
VKPGGKICIIYHVSRLTDIFEQATVLKLALLRIRMVHGHPLAKAGMVLVELAKGRKNDLEVVAPLFVHDASGEYSTEMKRILEELHA